MKLRNQLISPGFIAILPGIKKAQTEAVGKALFSLGFKTIEVILDSPKPYTSIKILKEILRENY